MTLSISILSQENIVTSPVILFFQDYCWLKKHILTSDSKEGKRGFRIYTPWDISLNKQAEKNSAMAIRILY